MKSRIGTILLLSMASLVAPATAAEPTPPPETPPEVLARRIAHGLTFETTPRSDSLPVAPEHLEECIDGSAGGFPCDRVDLLELIPTSLIGGGSGSDLWGWTDPMDGHEYVLMGRSNGTAFVDVTDPENPVYVGDLPTNSGSSAWRDIKTYADHAYIVSDFNGSHGMQVFDLNRLRSVVSPPETFTADHIYTEFGSTHNIVINEDSGYAYAVGISSGTTSCGQGLHMIDLSTPDAPVFAGCFSADGYTHDAQCVNYAGPDPDHAGAEVCFNSNEDTLTIVDVTNKAAPVQLSRNPYSGSGYTHQGWLTEDHRYFLLDDEVDEISFGHNTRTYIWDVGDLDDPTLMGHYDSDNPATDHNLYVHDGYAYQANYRSGLRILSLQDIANGNLEEVAFFDTFPSSDSAGTSDAWSVYPYFESGTVPVSSTESGLFLLRPTLCSAPPTPTSLSVTPNGDHSMVVSWSSSAPPGTTFDLYRSLGTCPGGTWELVASELTSTSYQDDTVSGQVPYAYQVRASVEEGLCVSELSVCDSATTTGSCTAPPVFGGLESVVNPAGPTCALDLAWTAGSASCGGGVSYSVYRDETAGFAPAPENRIAEGLTGTTYHDTGLVSGVDYFYVARSLDLTSGTEDGNLIELSGRPTGPQADGTWLTGAEVGDPGLVFGTEQSALLPPDQTSIEHIGWEIVDSFAHLGARSLYSTYANGQCTWMSTPPLELTPGESSELSFWTAWDIEFRWDGGVVEISTDGGSSWSTLALDQGYPDTFRSTSDACGFDEGDPAFTGENNLTWSEFTADLSSFAGQEIQIRWIFSTDGFQTEEGWYVDDITVTHTTVPGSCSIEPPLFADGFETGSTGGWSSAWP